METANGYTLRVSVRVLGEAPITGLEDGPPIDVAGIQVVVKQRGRFLVLIAGSFVSEEDAEAFLPRLKGGLWNLAIEHSIAFIPYFERREITRPDDPHAAARNLARSFGAPLVEPVEPVHGLTEEEGYAIFRSNETIRFFGMGDATVRVSIGWANAARTLADGIERVRSKADEAAPVLATAIDLYLSSFYETSSRARFLTLMTALEVLAPVTEKHAAAVRLLANLHATIEVDLAAETDPDARDALEALKRETSFRRETSIRRRIRHMVLAEAPIGPAERSELARSVVAAYDLRGVAVHSGKIDANALAQAVETALHAVKLLLRSRLGLAISDIQER